MRLAAGLQWARFPGVGRNRVSDLSPSAGGDGRPGTAVSTGAHLRLRLHPQSVQVLAAAIVAVLLGVFGYVLASSQATSRHEAEQRFQAQATIAAGLTKAIFSAIDSPQVQTAIRSFGSARIDPRALTALVKHSGVAYAYVAGDRGQVLAASAGARAAGARESGNLAVARALGGTSWFSDLVRGSGGGYLVAQAIPFPTRFGRRVEVLAYPARLLSGFLGSYLGGALPDETSDGYIVDGRGRIVASSVFGVAIGGQPSAQFVAVLRSHPAASSVSGRYDVTSGRHATQRYLAAASIGGSDWRVAITEPAGSLYPADVGSQWWVIWAVFVAFALAALGCLLLLGRSLNAAARLVEQAHHVAAINAELEATNAELGAFSYSVSHDLRAPLRAIDGFSRIVIEDDEHTLTDSQRRHLGLVRENTRAMGELIDDLLAFSRLANQPVKRSTVNTAALVEDIERDLVADQAGRAIEFSNRRLPAVEADPALVRQVFANLLSNAVKYSSARQHSRIVVDAERREGELVFSVADNGVGFDMRYADKLFQVFQRLHRAEDYEGTGVGLALVQRIITRHGGRVWAEGRPDEGATFYFTLKEAVH